jgi:aarF domain-containing kinase
MSGKRLLDAAKLASAGRAVGAKHFDLRRQQWRVWTEGSGLGRAVKSQTDRVTVTAGAAWQLARRVGEREVKPVWDEGMKDAKERVADEVVRGSTTAAGGDGWRSSTAAAGGDEALAKRRAQRLAEEQIPSMEADAEGSLKQADFGRDTFGERTGSVSPELSSLPRVKLPKHLADGQGGDVHVEEKGLNQDVYYSAAKAEEPAPALEETPEGVDLNIFSSSKVSQALGRSGADRANPYAGRKKMAAKPLPEMVAAMERRKNQGSVKPVDAASPVADIPTEKPAPAAMDAETEKLAESIMKDSAVETESNTTSPAAPYEMRESRVPESRFGRLWQYGGLATSMAFGAVGEGLKRFTGSGTDGSLVLSEANMNRLVAKLSKMRGAALKLGQMMSFQDSKVLPATINTILQRVQDSADYMPPSQRNQVLVRSLGENWRDLYSSFEERPFAAASIGQVHKATLASNGKEVAVKVQYPGVRNSIDSDLNNLSLLLTASRLLPKGLYLDKTIANARTELGWECDYEREAEACIRFRELLSEEQTTFSVPEIYPEACGPDVLTSEFMHGKGVTKIPDLSQTERDWIGTHILRLCLRELMEWRFMQTDPNWTNFLYNRSTQKLELLDFGASRDFPAKFVEPYVELLIAAGKGDRETCRDRSIELGYLTGRESPEMLAAHIDSIFTLGEPFNDNAPDVYDFENQTITDRVRANIGLMLRERMAPPPEETYSLHRKLSGAFLLCARLRSKIRTRDMFADAVEVWKARESGGGAVAEESRRFL